jgi:hypothetical protein
MPSPTLPDPADLQKFFENWWRTGSTIVVTLAGALISLQISSPVAYAIAVAVTLIGIVVAIILYRREAQGRAKDDAINRGIEKRSPGTAGGAFRGLRRFLRGELLPGPQRRRDAAQLLRQVVHPDFRIALVTGDSGAGKSSLLECALVGGLESAGLCVAMISNSGQLVPSDSSGVTAQPQIQPAISKIADEVSRCRTERGKAVVLILDQFEELLSRFRTEQDRNELGDAVWKLIAEGTRVVVGMRKEHLVDFRSIAKRLDYTVSFEDTFLVENFDTKEAAAVIRECAKQDEITPDQDLPELIAEDLAVDGNVRPADLQIICTSLSGDLTIERYRSEGRASGLRSHFIRGVIDITGDTVLAQAVLRELCDIPNNKKALRPLRAEDIAEKARLGAPGERATTEAVIFVLRALEQARVVVRVDSADATRWSLIHDYLVEPIKLATEEQTTRSEAAVARLDYFVTRAQAASGAIIPLPELRLIRRDAPPAAVHQPAARRLIIRSLLIGYGKPFGGAAGVALLAVIFVLALGTEQQWRVVDERPSSEGLSSARASSRLHVQMIMLKSEPKKPTVIVDQFVGDSYRLTTWNAETGSPIAALSGKGLSVADGYIWDFDADTGHLIRRNAAGDEIWGVMTPREGRPIFVSRVVGFKGKLVIFNNRASLDLESNKWVYIDSDRTAPTNAAGSVTSSGLSTDLLRADLVEVSDRLRLTVWVDGYNDPLFDEQFDRGHVHLLGLTDLGTTTALSFVNGTALERIIFNHFVNTQAGRTAQFSLGERKQVPIPKEFPDMNDLYTKVIVFPAGKRVVTLVQLKTRTIFWIFNPAESLFYDPMFGAVAVRLRFRDEYAWISEGTTGPLKIWVADHSDPLRVDGIQIRQNSEIEMSNDRRRILIVSEDGSGELWTTNFSDGSASQLTRIPVPHNNNLSFSSDQKLVLMRRAGGLYHAWNRDGAALGSLGVVGSEILLSLYKSECRQILLWTGEGQRLLLRRGFNIPLYGFLQERDCSGQSSWSRRIFDQISIILSVWSSGGKPDTIMVGE